jgi:hypothetical protein
MAEVCATPVPAQMFAVEAFSPFSVTLAVSADGHTPFSSVPKVQVAF